MAVTNANNLRILMVDSSSGTKIPIAEAQSASLSFSNSLIDVTTKSSNSWKEMISGQKGFSLSTDGLLDLGTTTGESGAVTIGGWAIAGTQVYFDFGVGTQAYQGSGFISAFDQSGGTDDAPTFSLSIEGTGALTYDADTTS